MCFYYNSANAIVQTFHKTMWPFALTRMACTLIERLAIAVQHKEPVILVGETGTGKTSVIQRLAYLTGRKLKVINLNQQSDSVDLLGGYVIVFNILIIIKDLLYYI